MCSPAQLANCSTHRFDGQHRGVPVKTWKIRKIQLSFCSSSRPQLFPPCWHCPPWHHPDTTMDLKKKNLCWPHITGPWILENWYWDNTDIAYLAPVCYHNAQVDALNIHEIDARVAGRVISKKMGLYLSRYGFVFLYLYFCICSALVAGGRARIGYQQNFKASQAAPRTFQTRVRMLWNNVKLKYHCIWKSVALCKHRFNEIGDKT